MYKSTRRDFIRHFCATLNEHLSTISHDVNHLSSKCLFRVALNSPK